MHASHAHMQARGRRTRPSSTYISRAHIKRDNTHMYVCVYICIHTYTCIRIYCCTYIMRTSSSADKKYQAKQEESAASLKCPHETKKEVEEERGRENDVTNASLFRKWNEIRKTKACYAEHAKIFCIPFLKRWFLKFKILPLYPRLLCMRKKN